MKRTFDIITDSGCDMTQAFLKEQGVVCVKLGFTMQNVNYEGENGEKIDEKQFYQKLRGGAMPTTYQVTGETAKTYMEKSLKKGRDVLVIAFSSALSGTASSFLVAQRELCTKYSKNSVYVVDSLCASMGQGLLLWYVLQKAETGATVKETADFAERIKGEILHHFTVDNLFHLKRGGRVSSATAFVGSILKIKPVLHVNEQGKLVSVGKAMGRKKALHALVERFFTYRDEAETQVFISHGDCLNDAEYVRDLLLARAPKLQITIGYIGAVIGSHAGAGTVALFHKGTKRQ